MKAKIVFSLLCVGLAGVTLSACKKGPTASQRPAAVTVDVAPTPASQEAMCSPPQSWLPDTPVPKETFQPLSHPASDCGFYAPAWQRFLVVTQPGAQGPAFLGYPSFDEIFEATSATGPAEPPKLVGIEQAVQTGTPGVLVDQNGRPVYYGIHVNAEMVRFLKAHNLTDAEGIENIDPNLSFPTDPKLVPGGVTEFKSAWMVVKDAAAAPNYFVVKAQLPHYTVQNGLLVQKIDPASHKPVYDEAWVALLALHVVFTLPGHPEMIWSTFEHVHADGAGGFERDNAPATHANPSSTPGNTILSAKSFPLYKANTRIAEANTPMQPAELARHFDEASQSFINGGTVQTSVYRPYPGSKTDPDPGEDGEVQKINANVAKLFAGPTATKGDLRQNYRLVGAIWIDDPKTKFVLNAAFKNPIDQTTEAPSVLGGEGRLGSTAIESFTEFEEDAGGSPNCFSCHDTRRIRTGGGAPLMPKAMLNVSHLLSRFKQYSPQAAP